MCEVIPVNAKALLRELNGMGIDSYDVYSKVFDMIDEAEVLDYAPIVHAHWKVIDKSGNIICSKCRSLALGGRSWFCPNCGAVMDEEVNNATDRR